MAYGVGRGNDHVVRGWTRRDGRDILDMADEDRDMVDAVRAAGCKPSDVRDVVHVLSLPTVVAVRGAARELRPAEYSVEYRPPSDLHDRWALAAQRRVDGLTGAYLSAARERFESLAAEYDGAYTGWYVPAVAAER